MSRRVRILRRAWNDLDQITAYIFEEAMATLAPEAEDIGEERRRGSLAPNPWGGANARNSGRS